MNILKYLFGSRKNSGEIFVTVTLSDRLMPIDRGEIYEDPLDEFLEKNGLGEVTGGGTLQSENGEIKNCELEIRLNGSEEDLDYLKIISRELEKLGAPKNSVIRRNGGGENFRFGIREGLAVYLDGVNLSPEVYQTGDVNYVVAEIKRLINDQSETVRYWEGERQTGLYFYSDSYNQMKDKITPFLAACPLCKGAQVERIA